VTARLNAAAAAQQSAAPAKDRVQWAPARRASGAAVRRKLETPIHAATRKEGSIAMAQQVKAQPGDENLPEAKVIRKGNAPRQQQEPAKPSAPKYVAQTTKTQKTTAKPKPPSPVNPEWKAAQERASKLKAAAKPAPSTAPKPGSKATG
jgi:hypothetical protein